MVLDLTHKEDTTSETSLRSGTPVWSSAQEEKTGKTDFLQVERGEDGVQGPRVVETAGLELDESARLSFLITRVAKHDPVLTSSGWSAHHARTYL